MTKAVGVVIDGVLGWHAGGPGVTDHDTLCGVDANDPAIGHTGVVVAKRGQKITCATCKAVWCGTVALGLKTSDFAPA